MQLDKVIAELTRTRASIDQVKVPEGPGINAIYLKPGSSLPLKSATSSDLLFIGNTKKLTRRVLAQHFKSGATGSSTLRCSLGALLKDELRLKAIPRGLGKTEKDYTHFKFTDDGEARLSEWMKVNLEVGVCVVSKHMHKTKSALVKALKPVLRLQGWKNPDKPAISAARKVCADEARGSH